MEVWCPEPSHSPLHWNIQSICKAYGSVKSWAITLTVTYRVYNAHSSVACQAFHSLPGSEPAESTVVHATHEHANHQLLLTLMFRLSVCLFCLDLTTTLFYTIITGYTGSQLRSNGHVCVNTQPHIVKPTTVPLLDLSYH